MKITYLPLAVAGIGVLLIVLSFAWPHMIGTEMVWSEQQALEHSQAAAELHRLQHQRIHEDEDQHGDEHGHQHEPPPAPKTGNAPEQNSASFEAAKHRYERSQAGLQAAQASRPRVAACLKWIGIAGSLAGAIGYYVLRAAVTE